MAEDANDIARVHYAALDRFNDFYAAFFQIHPRDSLPQVEVAALANPENHFLVAVDADADEIVGFIRWNIVAAKTSDMAEAEDPASRGGQGETAAPPPTFPAGLFDPKPHLKDLWDEFCNPRGDEMDECYEKAAKGERHLCKSR